SIPLACSTLMLNQYFPQVLYCASPLLSREQNISGMLFSCFCLFNPFCYASLHLNMSAQTMLVVLCFSKLSFQISELSLCPFGQTMCKFRVSAVYASAAVCTSPVRFSTSACAA